MSFFSSTDAEPRRWFSTTQLGSWLKARPVSFWLAVGLGAAAAGLLLQRWRRRAAERYLRDNFGSIPDQYSDLGQLQEALTRSGLPAAELVVAVDYSADNATSGVQTFRREHLHRIIPERPDPNPYQYALFMIAKTMRVFDSDQLIPMFGAWEEFDNPVAVHLGTAKGIDDLLQIYTDMTPKIATQGGFSWKQVVDQAIDLVVSTNKYHILLALVCRDPGDPDELRAALVLASRYPLSIVAIGVGDGPFPQLRTIDDEPIEGRLFDNFQFVDLQSIFGAKFPDVAFALAVLQEIPSQYSALRLLGKR